MTGTPAPTDLTDIETLSNYLKPGTSDTALLQRLLTAASVAIENYINRDIVSTAYNEAYDGNDARVMVVPNYPIISVASVTINGTDIPAGSVTVPGFYFSKNSIILNGYRFARGYSNVQIAYVAGYDPVPYDMEQFCIGLVQSWFNDRKRAGETSITSGDQTITFTQKDMPDWIKTGLQQYKRTFMA